MASVHPEALVEAGLLGISLLVSAKFTKKELPILDLGNPSEVPDNPCCSLQISTINTVVIVGSLMSEKVSV